MKTTEKGDRRYDRGKHTLGRKRHIVVDVLGLLLIVMVHSAGIQDRKTFDADFALVAGAE